MSTPSTPATAAASAASSATTATHTPTTTTTAATPAVGAPAAGGSTPPVSPAAAAASPATATPRTQDEMRAGMREKLLKTAEAAAADKLAAKAEPNPAEPEKKDEPNLGDPEATGEQPKEGEQKEGEQQTEQTDGEDGIDNEPFSLDEPKGPLPPRELNAKINANAALKAALEADPELKNSIFAASRLAQRAAAYEQIVGSPEEAQAAVSASTQFADLSNRFTAVRDEATYNGLIAGLLEASTLYDDEGQPLKDAKGNIRTDGSVGRLVEQNFAAALKYWEGVGKSSEDDELQAAVDVLKARALGGPASAKEGMTAEQQQVAEELRQERESINTERRTQREQQQTDFDNRVNGRVETTVKKAIASYLDKVELDDSDKADLSRKIEEKLYTAIHDNPQYQNALDPLLRRQGHGKKKEDDRVALAGEWANRVLPNIARKEMVAMGEKLQLRTQDKTTKAAARVAASRSEPATTITHTRPAEMTTKDVHAKVRTEFAAKNQGRQPNDTEMLRLIREYRRAG